MSSVHSLELYSYAAKSITYKDGRLYRGDTLADNRKRGYGKWFYRVVRIHKDGKEHNIAAHRLTWFLCTGNMPKGQIDHIDRDTFNNHIDNLRDVSQNQNQHNRVAKGYTIEKSSGKYYAQIKVNNRHIFLGRFDNPDDATAAYLSAKAVLHPTAPTKV